MASLRFVLLPLVALVASCAIRLPAPEVETRRVETSTGGGGGSGNRRAVAKIAPASASADTVPIYLLADNLHTALVMDLPWLEESGYIKPKEIGRHKYVTMSWGERTAYLQKAWLSPWQAIRALGTPSPSVMEIIPIDWKIEQVCSHQRIYLGEAPRAAGPGLAAFLNSCAAKNPDGRPETIAPSSWGEGRLIRSPDNYTYYFPRICNIWTVQALESVGFHFHAVTALSANGLIRQAISPRNGFHKIWDGD